MPDSNLKIILSFILLIIIAIFTSYYAGSQGRNPLKWFVIGLLLGILAPLILLFLPTVKKDKNGSFPSMTISPPDPSLAHLPPAALSSEDLKIKEEENKLWFYLDQNHEQVGPVSVVALRELWNRGKLELNQYVWSEGMEQWKKVEDLPELRVVLNKTT